MPDPTFSISVRRAAAADIPRLCELLALLFTQEAEFSPDAGRQSRALGCILDDPATGMIVCATAADDQIIGMVSLLFTISTAEGGRAAWLEDMVVDPSWRGRGVGERLLEEAVSRGRAAGCTRLTLLTDETNDGARRFYTRAGFVESPMLPMRLRL